MKENYGHETITADNGDIIIENWPVWGKTIGAICGAILPKGIIEKIHQSRWVDLYSKATWRSYSSVGDIDEGDFIINSEEVTAEIVEEFLKLTGRKLSGYNIDLIAAMKMMGGIVVHYDGDDKYSLGRTSCPPGLWEKRFNLSGRAITCLPFNNYFPERLSFSLEELKTFKFL